MIDTKDLLSKILITLNGSGKLIGTTLYTGAITEMLLEYWNEDNYLVIEQDGGGEGGSEDCYTIIKFEETYYRFDYKYYSHDGFQLEYSDLSYINVREVMPKQVMVTEYV